MLRKKDASPSRKSSSKFGYRFRRQGSSKKKRFPDPEPPKRLRDVYPDDSQWKDKEELENEKKSQSTEMENLIKYWRLDNIRKEKER